MDFEKRKAALEEANAVAHTICYPISDFSVEELTAFAKEARKAKVELRIWHETSNFHCGVLVEVQRFNDRVDCQSHKLKLM